MEEMFLDSNLNLSLDNIIQTTIFLLVFERNNVYILIHNIKKVKLMYSPNYAY